MSKIFLFVAIDVRPGKYEEFVEGLSKHISVIRTEAGCEFIDIYRDTQKENVVNVWEIWSNRPSLDAHITTSQSLIGRLFSAHNLGTKTK